MTVFVALSLMTRIEILCLRCRLVASSLYFPAAVLKSVWLLQQLTLDKT